MSKESLIAFPAITVEGSAYEIGFGHGSQAKDKIRNTIGMYQSMFHDYAGVSWTEAKDKAKQYLDDIRKFDAELIEEMQGIADGSGFELDDICALNCRSEVVLSSGISDGCTSIAIAGENTNGEGPILAQNWDWKPSAQESLVILTIKQKHKPDIRMVTEAGIIGKIGMNSSGVGVCLNALATDTVQMQGIPIHILLRGILNANTISEAVKLIIDNQLPGSANFVLAHKNGEMMDVEMNQKQYEVINPVSGIVTHTNHFVGDRFRNSVKDKGASLLPDTYVRYRTISRIAAAHQHTFELEHVAAMLANHTEYPNSICRHEDSSKTEEYQMATLFSIIMKPLESVMWVAGGSPCSHEYVRLNL